MQIIPAIDLIEGKCVRLTEGDYAQKKIYNEDPLEVAKNFEGIGLMRLHLVDLDGAKAGKVVNWKILEKIANKTNLKIDFGGGIKTEATLKTVIDTGATYAKLEGPSIELYKKIITKFPTLQLIASGGVSKLQDLVELRAIGCSAAIVGKAIYENRISLEELSKF